MRLAASHLASGAMLAAVSAPAAGAATVLETSIVPRALKRAPADQTERWLDDFIQVGGIRIEAVTPDQINLARAAHARFGKGSGHPAGLNFGDGCAYALAVAMAAPLLFNSDDFRQTDMALARA